MHTVVETAKANGLDSYWCLRGLFEQLPLAPRSDYRALIPQAFYRQLIPAARAAAGP